MGRAPRFASGICRATKRDAFVWNESKSLQEHQRKRGNMTAAAFLAAQVAIHTQIQARAIELGHSENRLPIYDGVVDAAGYLATQPKVLWILKEPYDDFDADGMPQGGGWAMFKNPAPGKTLAQSVNANAALRNVAYASAAMLNGVNSYSKLPWITDKPEMYENAVRRIAYCNIGKMPGKTTTSGAHLSKLYQEWKDILFRQIDLYAPEVIIVCGTDTLQALASDMGLELAKPLRTVQRGGAVVDVHDWRGSRLLWAPHPAARIPPGEWVDAVVAAASGGD